MNKHIARIYTTEWLGHILILLEFLEYHHKSLSDSKLSDLLYFHSDSFRIEKRLMYYDIS